jgi:excisionase family DNA binding protein
MSEHTPKPFTPEQRVLFARVSRLNRANPLAFVEADAWINERPESEEDQYRRFRANILDDAKERRQRKDRSYRVELSCEELGHGISTYERSSWERWTDVDGKAKLLSRCRMYYGHGLRYQRSQYLERIREEQEHGPLRPDELVDSKARKVWYEPPVFDGIDPEEQQRWARRVLRLVWILTDTADLTEASIDWIRQWKWGKYEWEYLEGLPVPRMHSRIYVFDRDTPEWTRLTEEAILFCKLPEPTDAPAIATMAEPKEQEDAGTPALENGVGGETENADICEWPIGKEVAEICGTSQSTVTRLIGAGELAAIRDGKVRRVSPIDTIRLWRQLQKQGKEQIPETASLSQNTPPKKLRWRCSKCGNEYDDSPSRGEKCDCGGELGVVSQLQKRE